MVGYLFHFCRLVNQSNKLNRTGHTVPYTIVYAVLLCTSSHQVAEQKMTGRGANTPIVAVCLLLPYTRLVLRDVRLNPDTINITSVVVPKLSPNHRLRAPLRQYSNQNTLEYIILVHTQKKTGRYTATNNMNR